jgi:hypothetical protein
MDFAGRFHYGRDICQGKADCWNQEDRQLDASKVMYSALFLMLIFMLGLNSGTQGLAMKYLVKLFGALDLSQSQSFFYNFF